MAGTYHRYGGAALPTGADAPVTTVRAADLRSASKRMEVTTLPGQTAVDVDSISSALGVLEGRVLRLIKECSEGTIPVADVLSEMQLLGRDTGRLDRRAEEASQRRDLPYGASAQLEEIRRHCVWLFRKIQLERIFFRKLHMEAGLRQLVSDEAFSAYQALLELEGREASLQQSTESQIRHIMREEALEDQDAHLTGMFPSPSEN